MSEIPENKALKKDDVKLRKRVISGAFWIFAEKGGLGVIEFAVAWVLARFFLAPEDYATAGLITIFLGFSNVFVKGGFNYALVQRKNITGKDKDTVFTLSLLISIFFYTVLFFCAPLIANFYEKPILTTIMRVEGIILIFDAISIVPQTLLEKELKFKKICIKSIVTALVTSAVALTLALLGFGVWTIVAEAISTSVVGCIMLVALSGYVPKSFFSKESFKGMFSFGSKMLGSNVINNVYSNALPSVMEKLYEANSLGYYTKAKTFPAKVSEFANSAVSAIVFPTLAMEQDNKKRVKEMTRRFIVTSCFITFSFMAGLIATAKPLILFIYSEKWAGSIVFMQFICISNALSPINSANLQAIKALGQGKIYIILEIIKNGIGIVLLGATMLFTRNLEGAIYYVLGMQTIISVICVIINAFPNKKLMGYSFVEQIKDILPSLLLAIFMGTCCYCVTFLNLANWLTLIIQVVLGVVIYLGGAYLLKFECLSYILDTAKGFLKSRKAGKEDGKA